MAVTGILCNFATSMKAMRQIITLFAFLAVSLLGKGQAGQFVPSERFSSGFINDICQDQYGYIWVATDFGLNKYDGYRFTEFIHHPDDSLTINSNVVTCLFRDKDGQLWIGTSKGIDRYDYATNTFHHYPFADRARPRVMQMTQLADGRLVACTSGYHGLYVVGKHGNQIFQGGNADMGYVNNILQDSKGRFWQCGYDNEFSMRDAAGVHKMTSAMGFVVNFAERGGEVLIFCMHGIYKYHDGQLTEADIDLQTLQPSDVVMQCIYKDRQGNIYVGTRGDGLYCLANGSKRLEQVGSMMKDMNLATAKIWAITEDANGNLWLGCQSKGLVMLKKTPPQFQSWGLQYQGTPLSSTISSVCEGDGDMVWCTVQGNGVYGFNQQGAIVAHPASPTSAEFIFRDRSKHYWIGTNDALYAYNPTTGHADRRVTFDCDRFNDMTDDGHGNIYISTFSKGFCIYNPQTNQLRNLNSDQKDNEKGWLCNNWILNMMPDRNGRIWLATASGVSCYDPVADSFMSYGWRQLLNGILCYSLCETSDGNILIGTEQGLYLYEAGTKEAVLFPADNGLKNLVVGYIVEANNGDFWCSTSSGLWHYDTKKKMFINHINDNGLNGKEYIYCVGMHNNDDRIYFVNHAGITTFRPDVVTGAERTLPALQLTEFFIAGHPVNTLLESNGSPVTTGPTIVTDEYRVSYLDNSITLEFSLLDYIDPQNIIFEYRINEGTWQQNAPGQNAVQLTHLQPGTYEIEVRALAAGTYSESKVITVRVTPPWYRSTLAYLLYLTALVAVLMACIIYWRRWSSRQMDEEKMKFLINATHDIRSPLTLIMGPLAKLKSLVADGEGKAYIDTIDRNANRLMLLVNQILDERRIDKNQMQLHCRETNLVDFISGICKLYQYNAAQRNITFTFEHERDHVLAWIDRINFDKVVSNLLSNAFKFTFDGGEVKVVLSESETDVTLSVVDSGVGIKPEDAAHIFDRFYQGRNTDDMGLEGTGIGLNLCKAITEMHHGKISAQVRDDGQRGSCFTVVLPKGNGHLKPEEIMVDTPAREVLSSGSGRPFRQFRILIVDDDHEIADYIINELGNRYKFDHAPNGKEGLKMLLTDSNYDLVISDVMMPEMDGITMLKRIKENPQISQLPVIMLTSKAEVEHKLEGLKSGADAYIAKPFNMEELHIQIDNLIDNVRRLRGKFSGAIKQEQRIENIEVKGNNDVLMERIMRSINAHMSESGYNVDTLAEDVGISRAQLHRKMKEMTGISSGKFLRNLRMEQAARLLREQKVNVSQVAYKVGYTDLAHFSTAFKSHFGQSPSEYADAHKEDKES